MLVQCFNDRDEGTAEDDDRHNFYGEIESWSYNFSPPNDYEKKKQVQCSCRCCQTCDNSTVNVSLLCSSANSS